MPDNKINKKEAYPHMKISEIYDNLETYPNLQNHMIWVASLAKVICDNWKDETTPVDTTALLQACLFHDAAKIINFKTFDQETEKWERVKKDYINKYGAVEHDATVKICEEVGVTPSAVGLLNAKNIYPFEERARTVHKSDDFALKLLVYCDSRVAPKGVTTLQERYAELLTRDATKEKDRDSTLLFLEIEKQIQGKTGIDLTTISQEMLEKQKDFFLNYEI